MKILQYINIRKFFIEDFYILQTFHVEHFHFYSISNKEFTKYLSSREYIVIGAISSLTIVGYIICLIVGDEAEIIYLCVHPNYHRIGIASGILQYLIRHIPSLKKIHLEVLMYNTQAIKFYKKQNFIITHVRKNYSDGHDAYAMLKLL
ncbi:MAG: GNAT family N-acetyltransferase [Holosporales bacterium]|nr:GNAT family N-acetyltransferase [Holosporales bacterium]